MQSFRFPRPKQLLCYFGTPCVWNSVTSQRAVQYKNCKISYQLIFHGLYCVAFICTLKHIPYTLNIYIHTIGYERNIFVRLT